MTDYDARPRAQATLTQLRLMRSRSLEPDGDRFIRHSLLGSREVWSFSSGRGENATYTLVHEQREEG